MSRFTPQESVNLLDNALQPAVIGKLTRGDFINAQVALEVLQALVTEHCPKTEAKKPETGGAFGPAERS